MCLHSNADVRRSNRASKPVPVRGLIDENTVCPATRATYANTCLPQKRQIVQRKSMKLKNEDVDYGKEQAAKPQNKPQKTNPEAGTVRFHLSTTMASYTHL